MSTTSAGGPAQSWTAAASSNFDKENAMPVIISLTCSRCRVNAGVPPAAVLIDRAAESVSWICLTCREVVERTLETDLLDAAANAGASSITSTLDRSHPESPPDGHDLSLDDLLELHWQLEQDGWYEQLSTFVTGRGD